MGGIVRMPLANRRAVNLERHVDQRLGFGEMALCLHNRREVTEVAGIARMPRANRRAVNLERLVVKRLGFGETAMCSYDFREVVELTGIFRALVTKIRFGAAYEALTSRNRLLPFGQTPCHAGIGREVVGGVIKIAGAFVMGIGIVPADFGLGDFTTAKGGPGGFLDGEVVVGFDFGEDIVGDGIVALFEGGFGLRNTITADGVAGSIKECFEVGDAFLGVGEGFIGVGDLGL